MTTFETDATVAALGGITLAYDDAGRTGNRTTVLSGLDLTLTRGEFVALVGASGVGKSTLLRVIAGLSKPTAGNVAISAASSSRTRPVGLVFQEARLFPWRRIRSNVELGLEGLPLTAAERHARAQAALDLVGLGAYADRWPKQLSGGQRQRVGLARAFAVEPELLLMDEPFGALDAITRVGLQDELLRMWQQSRRTVLFVTHDIPEAVYLADRVLLLAGRPGSLKGSWNVAARVGRPRDRASPELADIAEDVRRQLGRSMALGDLPQTDYTI